MNRQTLGLVLAAALLIPACVVDEHCFADKDCLGGQACRSGVCVAAPDATPVDGLIPDGQPPMTCALAGMKLARRAGQAFCVDPYEASRPDATATSQGTDTSRAVSRAGVLPWLVMANSQAAAACQAAGKRLCSSDEWGAACSGPSGTTYAYGAQYNKTTCNGIDTYPNWGFKLMPTGSFAGCTNSFGVFDMNGNVWEHVRGGTDMLVRGGAYNCSDSATFHRCDYVPTNWSPSALGFRCCADATAAPPDAGAPDAASPDAASPDAASPDAAPTDLKPPDVTPPQADAAGEGGPDA